MSKTPGDELRQHRWDTPSPAAIKETVLSIARAAIVGLNVFVDRIENEDDRHLGLAVLGVGTKEDARSLVTAQSELMHRVQLEVAIKEMDPFFKRDARTTLRTLKERFVALKLARVVKGIADNVNHAYEDRDGSPVFLPAGVETDEGAVIKAKMVAAVIDKWSRSDHNRYRADLWKQYNGCDLRCVRPGGCCPNAVVCEETLSGSPSHITGED